MLLKYKDRSWLKSLQRRVSSEDQFRKVIKMCKKKSYKYMITYKQIVKKLVKIFMGLLRNKRAV